MNRIRRFRALVIAALAFVPLIALYGWGRDRAPFELLEGQTLDWRFAWRGPIAASRDVALVSIDDNSIERFGGWPLPRRVLAETIDRLHEAGAQVIAFDLLLLELEQPTIGGGPGTGDQRLIEAMRNAGAVVLPLAFDFNAQPTAAVDRADLARSVLPVQHWRARDAALLPQATALAAPPAALLAKAWSAHANVAVEADGTLRALELVLPFGGGLYPALPLQAVRLFLHIPPDGLLVDLGRGVKINGEAIETAPGMRLMVNYYGPPSRFDGISLVELLSGKVDPARLRGKLVFVGATALGLGDRFASPYSAVFPGVEFFATAADNLLSGRWLKRTDLTAAIDIAATAMAAVFAALIGSAFSAGIAALLLLVLAVLSFAIAVAAFIIDQLWLNVVFPVFAIAAAGGTALLLRAADETRARRQAESERGHLARYVPEAIADELARSERPRFDERTQPASILFVDMAGFTRRVEAMPGEATLRLVRELHRLIENAVREHGGVIDKYIGDGAMVLFGLPEPKLDDAARGLACARALVAAVASGNAERRRTGEPEIEIGIGLHHGPVLVARIGDRQTQITALGDSVNTASRLERVTRDIAARIIISDAVVSAVQALGRTDLLDGFKDLGEHALRGRDKPIRIWRWPSASGAEAAAEREAQA
jgi:adenylate cyclase